MEGNNKGNHQSNYSQLQTSQNFNL